MNSYLTDAEIAEITFPLTQGAARRRHIEREYKVKVRTRPNGQPLVGRAEFEAALTSRRHAGGAAPAGAVIRPDWPALRAARKRA